MLCAFSSVALGAGELSCPPWENFAQEATRPTEIPAQLTQILLYHKGYGLFAKFAEEKKVLILQRPLRSTGQVIFLPQKGLYRQLVTPFQQELLLTTTAVHQRDYQGRVETMALDKLPYAKALVEGLLTVFSGAWESIHSHFQVYFLSADPQWRLGLLPKHTMMSQRVHYVILTARRPQVSEGPSFCRPRRRSQRFRCRWHSARLTCSWPARYTTRLLNASAAHD